MPHKEINAYYRMVRRCLPGSGKEKKRILGSIRRSVDEYLEENPHADMQTIQAHFGTPGKSRMLMWNKWTPQMSASSSM